MNHHRVSRALGVSHDRKCVVHGCHEPDVSHGRKFSVHDRHALGVSHGQRFWLDDLRTSALGVSHDRKFSEHGRREPDVSHDRKFSVHDRHEPDVSHGQRCELVGLRNDEVLRHRGSDVSHGHLAESCCGVQEVLGSSRDACRHLQLGVHHVNRVSHELGVHHGRRCAKRGLPNVMKVRRLLLREACVHRGRRLPKHPCGELILERLAFLRRARLSRQILACFFLLICVDLAGSSCLISG